MYKIWNSAIAFSIKSIQVHNFRMYCESIYIIITDDSILTCIQIYLLAIPSISFEIQLVFNNQWQFSHWTFDFFTSILMNFFLSLWSFFFLFPQFFIFWFLLCNCLHIFDFFSLNLASLKQNHNCYLCSIWHKVEASECSLDVKHIIQGLPYGYTQ